MKRKRYILKLGIPIFIISLCFVFFDPTIVFSSDHIPLQISVFKMEKSDCILIEAKDKTLLIDTGYEKYGDKISKILDDKGIVIVDYLILTHLDKDHIGGILQVMDHPVKEIIQPNYQRKTKYYERYEQSLMKNNITPILIDEKREIVIEDIKIILYPAIKEKYEKSNDYSIMVDIEYGKNRFLFAGDAESERLSEFISNNQRIYDVVKMPHHGIYSEMSNEFIDSVSPKYAIFTCSKGHQPDERVLKSLEKYESKVCMTCDGEVRINSDGEHLEVMQNGRIR